MDSKNLLKFPQKLKPARSPKGLGEGDRRLWREIQSDYAISDPGGRAHLMSACRAEDDLERLRAQVAKDGDMLTVKD